MQLWNLHVLSGSRMEKDYHGEGKESKKLHTLALYQFNLCGTR